MNERVARPFEPSLKCNEMQLESPDYAHEQGDGNSVITRTFNNDLGQSLNQSVDVYGKSIDSSSIEFSHSQTVNVIDSIIDSIVGVYI